MYFDILMVAPPSWIPVTSAPSSIFSASNQFVLESLDVDSCRVMNAQFDLYTIMREVHCAVIVIPGGNAGAGAVTITSSLELSLAICWTLQIPLVLLHFQYFQHLNLNL